MKVVHVILQRLLSDCGSLSPRSDIQSPSGSAKWLVAPAGGNVLEVVLDTNALVAASRSSWGASYPFTFNYTSRMILYMPMPGQQCRSVWKGNGVFSVRHNTIEQLISRLNSEAGDHARKLRSNLQGPLISPLRARASGDKPHRRSTIPTSRQARWISSPDDRYHENAQWHVDLSTNRSSRRAHRPGTFVDEPTTSPISNTPHTHRCWA